MKYASMAIIALAALGGVAWAAGDPMAAAYENTVVSTDEAGAKTKVMYNADNTYSVVRPDGTTGEGTWSLKDDQLCVDRTEPKPEAHFCMSTDSIPSKVGESKEATTSEGNKLTNTMEAGRS